MFVHTTAMMFRLSLLAVALPLALAADEPDFTFRCNPCHKSSFPPSSRQCDIGKLDATINVDHPAIGSITCEAVWLGVTAFAFNPEECGAIQEKTLATSDPCGCEIVGTSDYCAPPPPTNVQPCNICEGQGNSVGDLNRQIDNDLFPGGYAFNIWDGNPCENLFNLQSVFDFSDYQCAAAKDAAAAFCQCHDNTNMAEVNAVNVCHIQEDSTDPCYMNDPSSICCLGECKFRLSEGDNVCSTKAAQTPPNGYELPSILLLKELDTDPDNNLNNFNWADFQAPGSGACSNGGEVCITADDCCASLMCVQGSASHMVCAGGSGGITRVSAGGGGGAGGSGGMRRDLKKTSRKLGRHDLKKTSSQSTRRGKNLRRIQQF